MPNHRKESTDGVEKVSQLRGDEEVEAKDKISHFSLFNKRPIPEKALETEYFILERPVLVRLIRSKSSA